jgi:hypothetical protein
VQQRQVAWNAYLSGLSHSPSVDLDQLLDTIDTADSLLDAYVPKPVQTKALEGLRRAVEGIPQADGRLQFNPIRAISYIRFDP